MLSASDLALTSGDTPDLPTTAGAYVKLLAALSSALDTSSDSFLVGAAAGDFVIYTSGSDPKIVKGAIGFTCSDSRGIPIEVGHCATWRCPLLRCWLL
jgi:hypothetical protein